MSRPERLKADWAKQFEFLKGRTITEVRYQTEDEVEASGWCSAALVLELDDGQALWASRDDEGNDAGALFTTYDGFPIAPVI